MEQLQQMAFDALEEAGYCDLVESNDEDIISNVETTNAEESLPDGVKQEDKEDGSVVYTMEFSFDPEVQKDMSSAMAKGEKREDQPDAQLDLFEQTNEPVSNENGEQVQDVCPCCSQDESPFSDVLDSITGVPTEDSGRHTNTPLANCRAKDPMYCPYHGTQATQKFLEDAIANAGGTVPGAIAVETDDGHNFKVSITVPGGTNGQPYVKALSALMAKKGINASPTSDLAANQSDEVHEVSFNDPTHKDREGQFDEWVDNLLEDYANDNNSPLDPNDLAGFLGDYSDYKAMPGDPWGNTSIDVLKSQSKDAVEKQYHSLRAQIDMAHIKTPADAKRERHNIGQIRAAAGDWWNTVKEAAHIWDAAGVKSGSHLNKYPQQAQAIRSKFKKKYGSFFNNICKPYEDADANLASALQNNDMKATREALHKLDDWAGIYADAFPAFKKVADEYTQAANTYAKQQGVQVPQYQQQPWTP